MPEETATCERCGTFAILRSNGFRRWCDPCWLTASHAVDRPLHSVEALYKATFELLREYWWLSFFLVILTRVGPEMAVEASQAPAALRFGFNIVAASVAETIVLSVVLAKTLRVARRLSGRL